MKVERYVTTDESLVGNGKIFELRKFQVIDFNEDIYEFYMFVDSFDKNEYTYADWGVLFDLEDYPDSVNVDRFMRFLSEETILNDDEWYPSDIVEFMFWLEQLKKYKGYTIRFEEQDKGDKCE